MNLSVLIYIICLILCMQNFSISYTRPIVAPLAKRQISLKFFVNATHLRQDLRIFQDKHCDVLLTYTSTSFLLVDWSSALIYITDGDTEEHLEMLEGGVIKQLLDEKWKTYARVSSSPCV